MRDTSTRSFSAVSSVGIGERARREKQRKLIIAGIAVVSILIAVFTVLIFGEIFGWFDKDDGPAVGPSDSKLEFEETLISSSDIHKGNLLLVNSSFPYVFPEKAPSTISLYPVAGSYKLPGADAAKLETNTFRAFVKLTDDFAAATGQSNLYVYNDDGYRSQALQGELFKDNEEYDNILYTEVGKTEHHLGTAIDLYIFDGQRFFLDDENYKETYSWIYENAHKYGFIHRYPNGNPDIDTVKEALAHKNNYNIYREFYHFRNVGVAHATYIYENELTFEEYLDLLRDSHQYDGEHLKIKGADGNDYEVYYVKASSDNVTEVHVPKSDEEGKITYEVSGDNKEGFIVTVKISK